MKSLWLAIVLGIVGTMLTLYVAIFKGQGKAVLDSDLVFIVGPWIVFDILLGWLRWGRSFAIAAALMFLFELLIYYTVFINPQSSTDPLVYVAKPVIQLLILLPLGLLIGRVIDKNGISESE